MMEVGVHEYIHQNINWLTVLLAVVICLSAYIYIQWTQMLPGPIGLPYVGYYPFLSEADFADDLWQMSKKYGKVYCFKVTGQLYAHVIDTKTIKEICVTKSDCFDRRPLTFTVLQELFGHGVVLQNGEEWKVIRKFFIFSFRELGIGTKAQEGVMADCLKNIVTTLKNSQDKDFNATSFFTEIADIVIRNMIFGGAKLDENDVKSFNEAYMETTEFSAGRRLLLAGPLLKHGIMHLAPKFRRFRQQTDLAISLVTKFVRQLEKEFDPNNLRNLVDFYLSEKKQLEQKKDPKSRYFTERGLVGSILQFVGDGGAGVGGMTAEVLRAVCSRPDVQKAVQAEVDDVVGRNRFPSLDDKGRLQYTNAVIYEAERMSKFFPVFPALECTRETTIGGCRIPKGTIATYNLWAACHDPEVYEEPFKFDPTRFLAVDGKKPRCEIPTLFGIGKHSCVGEGLSSMEILLYVATVLQNFDLHPAQGEGTGSSVYNAYLRATPRAH